jgi:hypothetical protein
MRAPSFPPCVIERRGAWRSAVAALGAAAGAAAAHWVAQRSGVAAGCAAAAAIGAALLAGGGMLLASRLAPLELAYDGASWRLGAGQPAGTLVAVVDLGPWMLLRFVPDDGVGRVRWLPMSQARLPRQWHALRCALFAGRPGGAPTPTDRGTA